MTNANIEIQDIGNQPIFLFQHGSARVRTGYKYYIHQFDIKNIKQQVAVISANLDFCHTGTDAAALIQIRLQELDTHFKSIDHIKRKKRWDTLGTIWKYIAGTPDAEDLRIINITMNKLVDNNNEQIRINNQLRLQVEEAVSKTQEALSLFSSGSVKMHCINMLFHLNYLTEQIEKITDSITFAKIGVANENIFSKEEIEILTQDLLKEAIEIHSAAEALSYATTSVLYNNEDIAIIVKMPKLDSTQYTKVSIYPIIYNNTQIHLKHTYYIMSQEDLFRVDTLESTIYEKEEIEAEESRCIYTLLKGLPTTCNYTANPTRKEVIIVDDQHVLVNTMEDFTLSSTCGPSNRTLHGSFAISYHACKVFVDHKLISSLKQKLPGNPIPLSLNGVEVKKHLEIVNLTTEHLHNLHLETREMLEKLHLETNSMQWPHWHIFGGIAIPLLIVGIGFFSYLLCRRHVNSLRNLTLSDEVPQRDAIQQRDEDNGDNHVREVFNTEITGFRNITSAELFRMEPKS